MEKSILAKYRLFWLPFYDIMFMYLLCIYQKTIILSRFKILTLNFIMYILTILTCPLKHMSLDYII